MDRPYMEMYLSDSSPTPRQIHKNVSEKNSEMKIVTVNRITSFTKWSTPIDDIRQDNLFNEIVLLIFKMSG